MESQNDYYPTHHPTEIPLHKSVIQHAASNCAMVKTAIYVSLMNPLRILIYLFAQTLRQRGQTQLTAL